MSDLIEIFSYPIRKLVICLSSLSVETLTVASIIASAMIFIIIHRIFFGPLTGN